jgi:hypothetical protein
VITHFRKPVQEAALWCGIKPPHGGVDDGIQKLLKHLPGSPESSDILDDKGRKEDQPAADSDGCKYSNVKHGMFIRRWKFEVLSNECGVRVCQYVVVSGWVQVVGGGHWGLCGKFVIRGNE